MTSNRSALHKEANELDREMHRLVGRLDAFTKLVSKDDAERIYNAASELGSVRSSVRRYMHPEDQEATKYA